VRVDPVISEEVEPASDCRGAGFMMTKSSTTTVTTPAAAAATPSCAVRRSHASPAGWLITAGSSGFHEASETSFLGWTSSEAGREIEDDLIGSNLASCERDSPSFAALSRNRGGA
jgi:hypothetical protein